MKVFVLEDEIVCNPIIDWIGCGFEVVHARTIEDAVYHLEYEDENAKCDKYIFDASLPAATIIHMDGTKETFNGELNGIDYMISCIERLGLIKQDKKIAILTAFDLQVRKYNILESIQGKIEVISKNDNDLVKLLQNFLELDKKDGK